MDQIRRILANLSLKQKLSIVAAVVGVVAAIFLLVKRHQDQDFKPLYTGLSAEDAGQLVNRLKESAVEYRLADGGATVLVRSAVVAEQRLALAGAGLPKSGRIGFELFDRTNFGASDFAEQVNYRRALEGELERSVMSIEEVEQARVHLTFAKDSVFSDMRQPAKASVLLKLKPGARLSPKNVVAVGHLVANAVEGLLPEGVSIVDMQGNLLSKEKKPEGPEGEPVIESPIEYRQRIERDLLAKIQATMEPVMGSDHFRAGVSAEVDFSSGEQSEESWDPNRSVIVNQQRSEETAMAKETAGVPGTPSSLPRPVSRPGSAGGGGVVRRTENTQYQSSRLVRRTKLPQGSIRRISASVILDQEVQWQGNGPGAKRVLVPPSDDTLKKVRDLVAGAIGFQQDRGDQIFVQSLPFETTLRLPQPQDPNRPPAPGQNTNKESNPMVLIGAGIAIVLVIGGAAFFLMKRSKGSPAAEVRMQSVLEEAAAKPAVAAGVAEEAAAELPAKAVEHPEEDEQARAARLLEAAKREEQALLSSLQMPATKTKKAEVLSKHIADEAKRDPAMVAQLVRSWIAEKEH
ncbi:MAG: flagellar basal-body MS-ring/collar protein FliF [Bryobacteraceae bacterium]|nr:flagellar basal-body MS-ring/collar protein FliF [Bryobacteraceae bacterium]